ncbi:MAG: peptidoglycan bridge formation glycyltransferase FemA/FemB family protein [Rhodoglobus sp.]
MNSADDVAAARKTHFLQSPAWARFQQGMGRTVIQNSGEGWSYQAFVETGKMNTRLYAPYGPVVDGPVALKSALDSLVAEARRLGATFVRVEPIERIEPAVLRSLGLRHVHRVQPELTWRVDLEAGAAAVLSGMTKTSRNLYNTHEKKGLSIRRSQDPADIEILIRLLTQVASRTKMTPHSAEYLRGQARTLLPGGDAALYVVESDGVGVAVSLVYDDAARRYYGHAASDYEFRSVHPGNALVVRMLLDAVERGQVEFDFCGIAPENEPKHPWAGFTRFKKSFGGYEYPYSGTWELPVNRLGYLAYSLMRRVRG